MISRISNEEYIKKYWKDFFCQPDIKFPTKREHELKLGLPRCYDNPTKNKIKSTRS